LTDTRVRILYLSDIRFPLERANGIQTMETCYALAERNHAVTLMVRPDTSPHPRDPFDFYGLPCSSRLRVTTVPVRGSAIARRATYLAAALWQARARDHEIVFTRDLGIAAALLHLRRSARRPLVFESHGLAPIVGASLGSLLSTARSASAFKQRRLWARERRVWIGADGYVTITAALAQELEAHFGPRELPAVIPDGVRLPAVRTFLPPGPTACPVVAYAGHLYPWKGVDTLLHALARLPHAQGLIIGGHPDEPDLRRLQRLADSLGLGGRAKFTGLVRPAEVASYLLQADVLVLPNSASAISARYTSPLKLFEYLAVGRPIVAADLPAIREVLRDGVNAILVPADDAAELAAGVDRISQDRALATRLARTAFDDAVSYTWQARATRLEALFRSVIRDVPAARAG
jgi:glycosyltransferase involved in cell wall biosynthesis